MACQTGPKPVNSILQLVDQRIGRTDLRKVVFRRLGFFFVSHYVHILSGISISNKIGGISNNSEQSVTPSNPHGATVSGFSLQMLQIKGQFAYNIYFLYIFLFLFTSFLIGSFPLENKRFRRLLWIFYIFLGVSLCRMIYVLLTNDGNVDIFDLLLLILSPALPVLASRSLSEKQRQKQTLESENQRLHLLAKERDRIAQALHDDLGQSFSLLALKAEVAQKLLKKDPLKAQLQIEQIADEARADLELVRQIVHDLKYETLAQVLYQANEKLSQAKIILIVENDDNVALWKQEVQQVVAAVINEAVTNAIRYSRANIFKVIFKEDGTNYHVVIRDNGIGFAAKQISFGLSGIKQRVTGLGGHATFTTENGAVIILRLPKRKGGSDDAQNLSS